MKGTVPFALSPDQRRDMSRALVHRRSTMFALPVASTQGRPAFRTASQQLGVPRGAGTFRNCRMHTDGSRSETVIVARSLPPDPDAEQSTDCAWAEPLVKAAAPRIAAVTTNRIA